MTIENLREKVNEIMKEEMKKGYLKADIEKVNKIDGVYSCYFGEFLKGGKIRFWVKTCDSSIGFEYKLNNK